MSKLATAFTITGSANSTVDDAGLVSTEAEKKHIEKILVYVTGHIGNTIQLWLDQEKLAEYYDYFIITDESSGSTNVQKTTVRLVEIPVDLDIEVGQTFHASLKCGGTAKNLFGSYVYELI